MADLIETQEQAIASYPFGDIEDGEGYVTYYLFQDWDDSGVNFNMGKSLVYSDPIYYGDSTSGYTKDFYSTTFNLPRILSGTAMFNFCLALRGSSGTFSCTPSIKLYHYDGTTSTQLGSTWTGVSQNSSNSGSSANVYIWLAKIDVSTPKKFKKGDSLRIEFTVTNSQSGDTELGLDPQNRDSPYITPSTNANHTTVFATFIPFKVSVG